MSVSAKTHGSKRQPYDRIYEQSGRNQSVDGNGGESPFMVGVHNVYISRNTMRTVPANGQLRKKNC